MGCKNDPRWRRKTKSGDGEGGGKKSRSREEKIIKSTDCGLTSWAASEDQLTDFIVDKDEQGVWEGAEPPVGPGKQKAERDQVRN